MDNCPLRQMYGLIRQIEPIKHKKRQEFLVSMTKSMIQSRSVLFRELAERFETEATEESVERRIQDFFQKVEFDYRKLMVFFLAFVPQAKVVLSIDRTEWDFGGTQVNVLCVIASIGKMGIPLYFELLDNNSGNSGTADRIALMKEVVGLLGAERISVLVMDRGFIGGEWLRWLKQEARVPFCVRVPKSHNILLPDGTVLKAEKVFRRHGHWSAKDVVVDGVSVNCSLSEGKDGELLYLIGTVPLGVLRQTYRKRWTVEVFFQALKGRGFNVEESCLRSLTKYKKLFAVACMAYVLCWSMGIEEGKKDPVKVKKHGYPQYSVFRRGLNMLRKIFKKKKGRCAEKIRKLRQTLDGLFELCWERLLNIKKTIG